MTVKMKLYEGKVSDNEQELHRGGGKARLKRRGKREPHMASRSK